MRYVYYIAETPSIQSIYTSITILWQYVKQPDFLLVSFFERKAEKIGRFFLRFLKKAEPKTFWFDAAILYGWERCNILLLMPRFFTNIA